MATEERKPISRRSSLSAMQTAPLAAHTRIAEDEEFEAVYELGDVLGQGRYVAPRASAETSPV